MDRVDGVDGAADGDQFSTRRVDVWRLGADVLSVKIDETEMEIKSF